MDTPFPTLSNDFTQPPAGAGAAGLARAPDLANEPSESEAPIKELTVAGPEHALRDTLALALELAPQVMDNLIGRALLGMDRQSTAQPDANQRKLLDSAAVLMDGHRRRWVKQFAALLRVACAHPLPPDQAAYLPVADTRICATELAQLNELITASGSLRGNPLGPQTYVRAMGELLSRSDGSGEQRHLWGNFLLGALGTQLSWVYLQLNASLRAPESRETSPLALEPDFEDYAAYVFGLGGHAPPPQDGATDEQPTIISPQMRALAEDAKRTVKKLRGVLGLPDTEPGDLSDEPGDEMGRMMRDIEESERLMVMMNERGLQMPEDEPPELALQKRRDRVDRLLSEYRNMSNSALQRLPQIVRDVLVRFQAPLERLAENDASVFTQAEHPARSLMQAIGQRGLQIGGDLPEVLTPFVASVNKLGDALNAIEQPTAKVFEQALGKVQPAWQKLDDVLKHADDRKERMLAQLGVRKQLASRLAFELVSRSDASDAPSTAKQFLMGPWSQVMARSQLHPQHPQDEQRYEYVAALLLWSVSVRRAGSHKEQLVQRAPDLIKALRLGLLSVEHPQGEIDAFFQELKKLHDAVLSSDAQADDSDDAFPPEPPSSEDLSDMMQLNAAPAAARPPAPAVPSYQSDLNLL